MAHAHLQAIGGVFSTRPAELQYGTLHGIFKHDRWDWQMCRSLGLVKVGVCVCVYLYLSIYLSIYHYLSISIYYMYSICTVQYVYIFHSSGALGRAMEPSYVQ